MSHRLLEQSSMISYKGVSVCSIISQMVRCSRVPDSKEYVNPAQINPVWPLYTRCVRGTASWIITSSNDNSSPLRLITAIGNVAGLWTGWWPPNNNRNPGEMPAREREDAADYKWLYIHHSYITSARNVPMMAIFQSKQHSSKFFSLPVILNNKIGEGEVRELESGYLPLKLDSISYGITP